MPANYGGLYIGSVLFCNLHRSPCEEQFVLSGHVRRQDTLCVTFTDWKAHIREGMGVRAV